MSLTIHRFGQPNTIIQREGNVITASEDTRDMRCMSDGCTVTVNPDAISIRSFGNPDKNFDITLQDDKTIMVAQPDNGMRGMGEGFCIENDGPINRSDFERVGLNVAASITGYPLYLAASVPEPATR